MSGDPRCEAERARCRFFGFLSLTAWASLGLVLEAAHALKLSAYLDKPLCRELMVWAHAHGVGLSLIVLAYAAAGVTPRSVPYGRGLRRAAVIMPLAFALGVVGHSEADPGPSVWLVPAGALLLLHALVGITRALRT